MTGTQSARFRRRVAWRRALAALVPLVLIAVLALDRALPPDLARARAVSPVVVDAGGRPLRTFASPDDTWRLATRVDQVDPLYLAMLTTVEDRRFALHAGVDPLALVRAVAQWVRHGRVVSGASTLTMQTARLLAPRSRTVAAKLIEMVRALQLEARLSKERILGLYLTLAPMGGTLEGVRAGSLAWFGKEPRHLTPAEAALLVALPRAPSRLRPDRHPAAARRARDRVLDRALAAGLIDRAAWRAARAAPVPTVRRPMPFRAPLLARRLHAADPGALHIATPIDGRLQDDLAALAGRMAGELDPRASLAILVVDHRDRAVRAYVGSADFFDPARRGQVDLVTALRSPGSTLKPLLYALAFDENRLHPETLIRDVPTDFGGYAPANFRHRHLGEVSARTALQQSLNVPAVAVLEALGPARVAARLRRAGLTLRFGPDNGEAGLPLALGGVGVGLGDLTALYAALAGDGHVRPLVLRNDRPAPAGDPHALAGAVARAQVADILATGPRPGTVLADAARARARGIAYKTGTSYGFRDAWALGWDGRHVVGVWVGRPDGSPSPGRFGRNTAAPVLFAVFDRLAPVPIAGPPADTPERPPPALARFRRADRALAQADQSPPRITWPPHGGVLEVDMEGGPLALVAEGGRRPLRWLVDGRPVAGHPFRRQVSWTPPGLGFVTVTVIDADGRADRTRVRLVRPGAG